MRLQMPEPIPQPGPIPVEDPPPNDVPPLAPPPDGDPIDDPPPPMRLRRSYGTGIGAASTGGRVRRPVMASRRRRKGSSMPL